MHSRRASGGAYSLYKLWFDFNNYQSASVGENRGIITVEHQNLTGNGDIMTGRYGRSDGLNPLLDFRYSLPISARDTTLSLQYRKNTFAIVEQPFEDLEIKSKSDVYTLAHRDSRSIVRLTPKWRWNLWASVFRTKNFSSVSDSA